MKKLISRLIMPIFAGLMLSGLLASPLSVAADTPNQIICGPINSSANQDFSHGQCNGSSLANLAKKLFTGFIYVAGALSVVMVIVGGAMFATSAGNPDATKKAQGVILAAVIGLIVVVMAFAILQFVIDKLK